MSVRVCVWRQHSSPVDRHYLESQCDGDRSRSRSTLLGRCVLPVFRLRGPRTDPDAVNLRWAATPLPPLPVSIAESMSADFTSDCYREADSERHRHHLTTSSTTVRKSRSVGLHSSAVTLSNLVDTATSGSIQLQCRLNRPCQPLNDDTSTQLCDSSRRLTTVSNATTVDHSLLDSSSCGIYDLDIIFSPSENY